MEELEYPEPGYVTYPAAILMIVDQVSPQILALKRKLERNGCQVHLIDTETDDLATMRQWYTDLIVLDMRQSTEDNFTMYQKLKAIPELAGIPVVMPATGPQAREVIEALNKRKIYYLPQNTFNEAGLMPIVERTLYMTYRYLPLCIN
jgi:CheY-like chemotaxis protein